MWPPRPMLWLGLRAGRGRISAYEPCRRLGGSAARDATPPRPADWHAHAEASVRSRSVGCLFVVSVSVGFEMGPVRVSIGIESVTDARAKRPNANMQNKQITRRNDLCIVLLSSAVPVRPWGAQSPEMCCTQVRYHSH